MKFIFDFDDVLFNSTKQFKGHMYACLEKAGITRNVAEEYYKSPIEDEFWLKRILKDFSVKTDLYEEILKESRNFLNIDLLEVVKKLGKDNCYIVSYGNKDFQLDKINRTNINSLFFEIIIVPESKKGAIEKICTQHKNEEVLFIDDKAKHFEDLDFAKYPNLKTILYDEQGLEKITSILPQS